MKKLFTKFLFGSAGLLWVIGLGLSFRSDSGMYVISAVGAYLAWRFGPSLAQGRIREELRIAVPNPWVRRYLALAGFCVFAIPGILSACGQWSIHDLSGRYPQAGGSENWNVVFALSALLPAILLAVFAQAGRTESEAQPKPG